MSAEEGDGTATVELLWGGKTRKFRLGLGEIKALQTLTGFGPQHLFNRIVQGIWFIEEPAETIRLGLEGAGVAPAAAYALTQRYCYGRPLNESLPVAARILQAVFVVPKGEEPKKDAAETAQTESTTQTDDSPSPPSTEPEPPSA